MEDELEQEGMEEEVGEPQPEKGGGSPLKKIIIIGVMAVVAVIIVFFLGLNPFLGDEPAEGEGNAVVQQVFDTSWGKEYPINPENGIVHSMLNEQGRVKNVIIYATLITEKDGTSLFMERAAQINYLIKSEISKYSGNNFKKLLDQQYQDSITVKIAEQLRLNLPLEKIILYRVLVEIVTM